MVILNLIKAFSNYIDVFKNKKMAFLLLLGITSGLPFFLTNKAAQAWMSVEKIDISTIGFMSLAGLPYSLKFLWAPLMDRYSLFNSRRKGWIVIAHIFLIISIAAMYFQNPAGSASAFAINILFMAFFSASFDIAYDAYKIEILDENEFGAGAALSVLGYRIALIITGSFAFIFADKYGWGAAYLLISFILLLNAVSSLYAPPSNEQCAAPQSLKEAVINPFVDFFKRKGAGYGAAILLFIILFKFGDSLVGNMSIPFLITLGFTQSEIGVVSGGVGLFATIAGVIAGGAVLSRIGINKSLWIFGFFQALSNFSYYMLFFYGKSYGMMTSAIIIENVCAGLGTASFVAFLMSLCNREYSATQYALLTSLMAVSRDIIVSPAGKMVEYCGWPWFFLLSVILSLPGIMLLKIFAPWDEKSGYAGKIPETDC